MRGNKEHQMIIKTLCCNCLGEEFIWDCIIPIKKCLNCGAINDKTFRFCYYVMEDPTGCEL